jgi:serine O-acetyltransferase
MEIVAFLKDLSGALFMDYARETFYSTEQLDAYLKNMQRQFEALLYRNKENKNEDPGTIAQNFFDSLPEVYEYLEKDISAIFDGDPAAKSEREIIRSYPGFYATMVYRIANSMYKLGVKDIPRILTEYAHSKTGIDIHPGASIDAYFCIDHGTGVVIGETADIGQHVKIYQGVTLGALSVDKSDANTKRHPTIEDGVVIYANAAILGGKTVIGKNSVIGGNVWLTRSVPENTKLYYKANMHNNNDDTIDTFIIKETHS